MEYMNATKELSLFAIGPKGFTCAGADSTFKIFGVFEDPIKGVLFFLLKRL